ncbi:hypothetical protein HDU87_004200 [Geranomyces variabilis]|uniref:Fibronectin type-III domain-containing protein n=1 Tax=Geranomyces variabilis TaxID=109894 RepID=A0AAD5XS61_9FUNG|nr:hypothetical protein HDU87_004200 [Geranomyces variabilis]
MVLNKRDSRLANAWFVTGALLRDRIYTYIDIYGVPAQLRAFALALAVVDQGGSPILPASTYVPWVASNDYYLAIAKTTPSTSDRIQHFTVASDSFKCSSNGEALNSTDAYYSSCVLQNLSIDFWNGTFSPSSRPSLFTSSETYYLYIKIGSPRSLSLVSEWFPILPAITWVALPGNFSITMTNGTGDLLPYSKYVLTVGSGVQFKISPSDASAQNISATIDCNNAVIEANRTYLLPSTAWNTKTGLLNMTVPQNSANMMCTLSVSLINQNGGTTINTTNFAVVTLPPATVADQPLQITSSILTGFQSTPSSLACASGLVSYSYDVQLNCINCFSVAITATITAVNVVGLPAIDTVTVPYSGAPTVISALLFSASKVPYAGKLWYCDVTTALFNATISSATAPWTGTANVVLGISVGSYPLSAGTLTTLHDVSALLYDPNGLQASIFPGTPPSTAFRATKLQFRGAVFHGESYRLQLSAISASGLSSSSSAFVYLDTTAPVIGSAHFTAMVVNEAAQQAQVAIAGLFDPESGIKEVWWRVGGDVASTQARDFGNGSSWKNVTNLAMSTTVANLPASDQTIAIDLSGARASNWTTLYVTVAVINHAWTTLNDSLSVTYQDLIPLSLDPFTASTSITGIDVAGASGSQNLTGEQTIEVHWLASNVVAGIAFATAQLSFYNRTIVTSPYYADSTVRSIDIPFGGPIPADIQMTVCVNATSNSMPPTVHYDCKFFARPPAIVFDAPCVQTGLIYHLQSDASAVATIFSNWTSCSLPGINTVTYWLASDTDFTPVVSGSVAASDLGVPISIDGSWIADHYKFCFMALASSTTVGQNFCTAPQAVDLSPPLPLGQIFDAYSGGGLVPNAMAVRYSSNTASYLVRWDDWVDPDSGISSFSLSLMLDGDQPRTITQVSLTGDKRAYLFEQLSLNVSSKYFATLSATNNGNLTSQIVQSPGVEIVQIGTSGSPEISVDNGIDILQNGVSAKLFIPSSSAFVQLSWHGFLADSVLVPCYRVDLLSNSSSTALPITNFTTQNDIQLQVPGRDDTYILSVTLQASDGTSQRIVADKAIWVSKLRVNPPSKLSCDVDFTKYSPENHTLPFTATLTPAVDVQGLLVNQTIGFRHAGMDGESSSVLTLGSNDTAKSDRVVYIWGVPSIRDDYQIECVWEGTDVTGQVTVMSYAGVRIGNSSAIPVVFALPSWTKVAEPSSGTDLAFFDEVAVTPNSTFMVGLQSFSPILIDGAQAASLSYCVYYFGDASTASAASSSGTATANSSITALPSDTSNGTTIPTSGTATSTSVTETFTSTSIPVLTSNSSTPPTASSNSTSTSGAAAAAAVVYIVPWTPVDVFASQPLVVYKIRVGSTLVPITVFEPVQFTVNGGFPSDLSMVYICASSTSFATNVTQSACSNGITWDSVLATPGTVSINDAQSTASTLYLTATDSISVAWQGFLKTNWQFTNDSGIQSYQWAVGSFAGADDYVPFSSVPGTELEATADVHLTDGNSLYATVIALDYAGRSVRATSPLVIVDSSPPVSFLALPVLARPNLDGTTFVRIDFPPWQDPESGLSSVVWTVESAYGAADILPISPVTYSNMAYANLPLLPGFTYLARMIATNRASLSQEIVYSFTTGASVHMVYFVDGSNPKHSKRFDSNPQNYTTSWNITGSIHAFVVGVGTSPRQDDIWSFRQMDPSVQTLTVPLKVSDGVKVYATIFVQDSGGNFLTFVTAGMICDASPPTRGWVTVGPAMVHQMTVPNQAAISASWIGFSDPESDIARYEYCIDLDDDLSSPRCAITNSWVNAWTQLQIVGAPIAGGALLPIDTQCFIKVRATNHAGGSVLAVSPPFTVDPAAPQGGQISIAFPSAEIIGASSIAPLAKDGTQLYLDSSCVNVSWSFTSGNIENYRVALFQAPGAAITRFSSVGAQTSFTFVNLKMQTQGPGQNYFAVVQAWTAAGVYSEITRPFRVIADPPGNGKIDILSVTSTAITFFVSGFLDLNALLVTYEFSLGSAPYAADQTQLTLADCWLAPCTYTLAASLDSSTIYYLTARAVNEAGLFSAPATASVSLPTQMSTGSSLTLNTFLWNVTMTSPIVNTDWPNATLTGANLSMFLTSETAPTSVVCMWPGLNHTGTLAAAGNEDSPLITCGAPLELFSDGGFLTLAVTIDGSRSNSVKVLRRELRTDWASSIPQCGLAATNGSKYRLSTSAIVVRWATTVSTISYFQIKRGNDRLPQIWPSSARSATVLTASAMSATETFSVCAYFSDRSSNCVAAPSIVVDFIPTAINSTVSTDHDGPLSTTVRITTAPNLLPLGTSQYLGPTAIDITWQNSFIADGAKVIANYLLMLGTSPMSALNGVMVQTTQTTATLTAALVAGVPYFATVLAVDETGLYTVNYSSPFVVEISAVDAGTVHIGKSFYTPPVAYQTSSSAIDFYLRGWSDHISGVSEFFYRVCTAASCNPSIGASIGLSVDNTVTATLSPGSVFWVSVQATNGAGRTSDWVNSSAVVVDAQPPVISSIQFTGASGGFAAAPVAGLGLVWNASTFLAPIREFTIQVGTTSGGGQLLPPTNVGSQTSFSLGTLALTHNITVYATVFAVSQNGLTAVKVSEGLRTDFTEPRVNGPVIVLSGGRYINALGSLTVTADWTSVFSDEESPIVDYQWAIGTAGAPTQYSKAFVDAKAATTLSYDCEPTDNSDFVVTVTATNVAGLSATATSMLVMKASKHPPAFTIAALNEGTVRLNETWFIPSSIGRFSLDGLADPDIGLTGVEVQLLDVATNSSIRDWFSIGIPVAISLDVDDGWLFKRLQLNARASNNLNLTTIATSLPFVMNSTDAI